MQKQCGVFFRRFCQSIIKYIVIKKTQPKETSVSPIALWYTTVLNKPVGSFNAADDHLTVNTL